MQLFGHNRNGPKIAEGKGTGSPSNTKSPGPRPTSIPSDILIHAPFGRNRYGPKIGGLCPFRGGGAGSPLNTIWPGSRPTCMPSFILIRPTIWPQYTVTDRQADRTGQRSDSIGRTVLQTVAQKLTIPFLCYCTFYKRWSILQYLAHNIRPYAIIKTDFLTVSPQPAFQI